MYVYVYLCRYVWNFGLEKRVRKKKQFGHEMALVGENYTLYELMLVNGKWSRKNNKLFYILAFSSTFVFVCVFVVIPCPVGKTSHVINH